RKDLGKCPVSFRRWPGKDGNDDDDECRAETQCPTYSTSGVGRRAYDGERSLAHADWRRCWMAQPRPFSCTRLRRRVGGATGGSGRLGLGPLGGAAGGAPMGLIGGGASRVPSRGAWWAAQRALATGSRGTLSSTGRTWALPS